MTDYKSILKSNIKIVEPKIRKRNVKITCHNKNAGSKVIATISQNSKALFGGYTMKDISTGGNDKDFTVKMELRDGAQTFYDNLTDILNDNSVPEKEPEKSPYQQTKENIEAGINNAVNTVTSALGLSSSSAATTATAALSSATAPAAEVPAGGGNSGDDDSGSSKTMLYVGIGGAVLLVLVLALVIWKSKK